MKPIWILAAITLQVVSVAYIAVSKEVALAYGDEIILQTSPVDPRDIFRGDYVRLKYSASTIPANLVSEQDQLQGLRKGQKVYVGFDADTSGVAEAVSLSSKVPQKGQYLTAYVKGDWPFYRSGRNSELVDIKRQKEFRGISVRYGLEQYYVGQGSGLAIEKIRGERNNYQVAMLVHAAVLNGSSVIRSYEWSNVSIKTELLTERRDEGATIKISIKNRSEEALNLPWKANGCSLQLVAASSAPYAALAIQVIRPECNDVVTENVQLQEGQEVTATFDFSQPQWQVMLENEQVPLSDLGFNYRFRLVHEMGCLDDIIGKLVSTSFHARGRID